MFLGYVLYAGWIWKGDIFWSQTLKNWSRWTHLESTPEGSTQRKCERQWEVTISPVADGTVKIFWMRSASENIHLDQGSPRPRRRTRNSSRRVRRTLFSNLHIKITQHWMMRKPKNDFLSFMGDFHLSPSRETQSQTLHAERRIISYSAEIYRRYQKYSHIIGCNAGENIDDCWNVDGDRELSDTWTEFTRVTTLKEKPLDGCTWSGRRLTRKQTTSRPDKSVAGYVEGLMHRNAKKSKNGPSRSQNSITPEDYVVISLLNLTMKNSCVAWKMLVESWNGNSDDSSNAL